jgi:D-glycero-alpha-D-manno-heptose 1-phosphate guanylyltransferase
MRQAIWSIANEVQMNNSNLLVLAGGFGTRLRSVVSDVPKALAPVAGQPFLQYLIDSWLEQGLTQLTFLLHYQANLIEAFLEEQKAMGRMADCEIRILSEPQALGTGGAVAYAVRQLGLTGSFLVTNADTWLGAGVARVSAATTPAIGIVRVGNSERYGSVKVRDDRIVSFEEKQDSIGPGWINAGMYHLHADLFQSWDCQSFSLERELFPKLVATGQLRAVLLETEFIDIGVPDDYHRFGSWINSEKSEIL